MQELNLSPAEIKILLIGLVVILIKLWRKATYINLDCNPQESPRELEEVKKIQSSQARYGAYIQAQGRYH